MRIKKKAALAGSALVAAVAMTGCAGPVPDQQTVTLQYEGGKFIRQAAKFKQCVAGGTRGDYDFGGRNVTYPGDQRVVDFGGGDGADRSPYTVVSKDGIEMEVPGSLQYTLNIDCTGANGGVIGAFNDNIGRRYDASFNDGLAEIPDGWRVVQRLYVEQPLEAVLDRAAKQYNWLDLFKNPQTKLAFESDVRDAIKAEIDRTTPTDNEFYLGLEPRIGGLNPTGAGGEAAKAAIANGEQKVAEAKAREAQALADKAASNAQVAVSQADAKKKAAEIRGYGGVEAYNRAKLAEAGINIYQPQIVYGVPAQPAK